MFINHLKDHHFQSPDFLYFLIWYFGLTSCHNTVLCEIYFLMFFAVYEWSWKIKKTTMWWWTFQQQILCIYSIDMIILWIVKMTSRWFGWKQSKRIITLFGNQKVTLLIWCTVHVLYFDQLQLFGLWNGL